MPILFQKRQRDTVDYSPRKEAIWVPVQRKGQKWADPTTGGVIELFRIKTFAEALDRTTEVIKDWERKKYIPPPLFAPENEQCKHWYSAVQIINCHRIMLGRYGGRKYMQDRTMFDRFIQDIRSVWYAEKITVSEKGEEIK